MKTKSSLFAALGVLALASQAFSQNATTTPVGAKTTTIYGNGTVSFVSVDLLSPTAFRGSPESATATTLVFSGVDFTTTLSAGSKYYLEVLDGAGVGQNTLVNSWTSSQLTTATDISANIVGGSTKILLRELPTIADVFGATNDVLSGGSSATADLIYLRAPASNSINVYFYSTGGFTGVGWRQLGGGTANKSAEPIYTTSGIYVLKKSSGNSEITVTGEVKDTDMVVAMPDGFIPYSGFPSGITLAGSGLYNSTTPANSISAGSSATADLIYTDSNSDGILEVYYYSSGGFAGTGWRQLGAGSTPKDSVSLANGFGILNKNGSKLITLNTPL